MGENRGWALVGKWAVGLLLLAGVWFGVNWGYNAIVDVGVRECTRAKEKEIAGLKTQIAKLTTDLGTAQKQVAENTKAVDDAKGIVADHGTFVALARAICEGYDAKNYLKDTIQCRDTGVTVGETIYEYTRDPAGKIQDLVIKPVVQPTLQGNAAQAANR